MAKSENDNMINIVEVLGLEMNSQKKKFSPVLWLLVFVVFLAAALGTGLLLLNQESGEETVTGVDFSPYLLRDGPYVIVEARFLEQWVQAYDYEISGHETDLTSIHTETNIGSFDVQQVYYGSELLKGVFELETAYDCGFLEGTTYLLFIYKGGEYVTDFYSIEEPVLKSSPYYILEPSVPLITRNGNGAYILADGSLVSEEMIMQELSSLIVNRWSRD